MDEPTFSSDDGYRNVAALGLTPLFGEGPAQGNQRSEAAIVMVDKPKKPLLKPDGGHFACQARGPVFDLFARGLDEGWEVYSSYSVQSPEFQPKVLLQAGIGSCSLSMPLDPVWARLMAQALNEAADTVDLVKAELKKQAEATACSSK